MSNKPTHYLSTRLQRLFAQNLLTESTLPLQKHRIDREMPDKSYNCLKGKRKLTAVILLMLKLLNALLFI